MKRMIFCLIIVSMLFLTGCTGTSDDTVPSTIEPTVPSTSKPDSGLNPYSSTTEIPSDPAPAPEANNPLEIQKVLNLGIMVHLEGWEDGVNEVKFQRHASLLREYADLFEKYGAKLTLESKEMTDGAIRWNDNVLLEMQNRGHAVGVHADVGGSMQDTLPKMKTDLSDMKARLESLGVRVRHVSGINSHCDWVTAVADTGFEFATGVVTYALLSLPEWKRPIAIPDDARPSEYHQAYPLSLAGRLFSWRAENGSNWIDDTPTGRIVIIPSGNGLANAFEEATEGPVPGGNQDFTVEDIEAFKKELDTILAYIESEQSTQPYTYYLSWSFGKTLDMDLMEQWLQMVDEYVDSGKVQWKTIPEMYDDYVNWEIDTGRR